MQLAVIILMAAGYFALSIVLSLRIINLVQLEGYKLVNSRKMKAVRLKLWGGAFCITLCNLLFLFIAIAVGNSYIQLAVQGLYIVILLVSLTDERDKCTHQPLVFTPRAKRLIVTYGIVAAAAVALCVTAGCFIRSGEVWACFIFIPLAMALLPEYVMLALIINKPFEKAIAGRYVKKCKDKLQSMHLLRIGITGSFGKTSVKNILTTILSEKYRVYCTPHNYNTPMGICKAVGEMPDDTEVFVAEMGARHKGDIAELCDIVKPNYGIITGVGSQHLGVFKTQENIYETKKELNDYIEARGGKAVVFNADNAFAEKMYYVSRVSEKTLISSSHCENHGESGVFIRISDAKYDSEGITFKLYIGSDKIECKTKLIGQHNLTNILMCVAMAYKLNLNIKQIAKGISKLTPTEHRLEVCKLKSGITVIDDSYNSNYEGAKLAVETLKMFKGRKIVATQGLVELGREQIKLNFELGESIAETADIAILIGVNREDIRLGMLAKGFCDKNIYTVEHLDNAKDLFSKMLKSGDVLLIQNDLPDNYQ